MSEQAVRDVVSEFKGHRAPGASEPFSEGVQVVTWYREPDFSRDYRRLRELELELSDLDIFGDMELLSVWRLAREQGYPTWAREARGTKKCQIAFFGTGANHDWFIRRRGAFDEALLATERCLEAGIIPRWELFLTKRMAPDLPELLVLVDRLDLRARSEDVGGEFVVFIMAPAPDGEAMNIEHLRPTARDIAAVPEWLAEASRRRLGDGDPFGEPEGALVRKVLRGDLEVKWWEPPHLAFLVDARLDVYSNCGGGLTPWWRLGDLKVGSLSQILDAFENDSVPGLRAAYHVPTQELAERYGRPNGRRYYCGVDLLRRWVNLWCREHFPEMGGGH